MKKLITAFAIVSLASLTFSTALQAQTTDPKTEWATKVVALQQGPELDYSRLAIEVSQSPNS